ncbi:class I SAM-dependent methyltransferase [bacterium]|nr:class I SAM-dependent methyltransferase [bacterium]
MNATLRSRIKATPLYRMYYMPYRLRFALSYFRGPIWDVFLWLFRSRETANFSYDLDEMNVSYLASFISTVTGAKHQDARAYLDEVLADRDLKAHLVENALDHHLGGMSDNTAKLGRRIGWYALVRILKPKVVVETGVEKGLGSCVLAAALKKNTEEGFPGKYYGTELMPAGGGLLRQPYSNYGKILYGDSIESLKNLSEKIDFFINDSDHSADYEAREYEVIREKLAEKAVILGDNAHVTDKLQQFALRNGMKFLFFREKPKSHWYPGGGIGVAFR